MMCEYCEEGKDIPFAKMFKTDTADGYISITMCESCHSLDFSIYSPDILRIVEIAYCPMCGRKLNEAT